MLGILYSLLGALLIGFHIFLIKYIQDIKNEFLWYVTIIIALLLFLISRVCIYYGSKYISISYVHILLNLSALISTVLAVYVYDLKIDKLKFILGFILILLGIYIVKESYYKM